MNIVKSVRKLCTPSYVYLVLSVLSIVALMFQNAGNTSTFCIGSYDCPVSSTGLVFASQVLYVAFWTFVLNAICKAGYKNISWFLVLVPFIFFFISLGLLVLSAEGDGAEALLKI